VGTATVFAATADDQHVAPIADPDHDGPFGAVDGALRP
jgi:hypothetical protein